MPDPGPEPDPVWIVAGFADVLRHAGVAVPPGATVAFGQALAAVGVERASGVYWAGRATLIRRPEDIAAYDRAFAAFFGITPPGVPAPRPRRQRRVLAAGAERDVRWSDVELLRHKDLASCTPDELAEAHRMIRDVRLVGALRRSRRRRPRSRGPGRPDLRRTVRRSLGHGGEILQLATTRSTLRPRRLVLLLDVSGSMEPYARALARFAHVVTAGRRRGQVEVFALGTRVTRISRELAGHDPDEALARATAAVPDWAGGTRLGEGMRAFNERWGVRGLARGAVVVVLSDGWDRGDPEVLGSEMARLARVAHRVVWVNPLKAAPGYAPLAGGMAAALPHLDEFVEGHSVASLAALAHLLGRS